MRRRGSKDVSIIWTSFLMKIVGLWLATDRNEQRCRDFALIYTVGTLFISICIAFRDIYYSWGNFSVSLNHFFFHSKYFEVAILQQVYKIGELIKHPFVVEIKMWKRILLFRFPNMIIFRIAFLSAAIFCTWRSYCWKSACCTRTERSSSTWSRSRRRIFGVFTTIRKNC